MAENEDIIKLMLQKNLINLCFDVFAQLDSKSIANSRLVCQNWKNFIDEELFNSRKGKLCIQQKITANILNENFLPRIRKFRLPKINGHRIEVKGMEVDEKNICIYVTQNTSKVVHRILYHKLESFDLVWMKEEYIGDTSEQFHLTFCF